MQVLLVLSLSAILLSEGSQNNAHAANSKHYTANNTYSANAHLLIVNLTTANDSENRAADQEQNNPTRETRYFHLTIAEWAQNGVAFVLAVITGIYVGITSGMLGQIKKQAGIMEQQAHNAAEQVIAAQGANNRISHQIRLMQTANDQTNKLIEETRISADAAKTSADVLVNSERAWLLVDVERAPGSAAFLAGTNADNGSYAAILVDVIAKNQGRSPAWIIQHFQFFELLDSIPPTPTFEKHIRDGDIYSQPVAVNGEYKMRCDLVAEGRMEDKRQSIVYGIIRYRDIFWKIRYTTYGYYVDTAGGIYRMTDHPEYNTST